MHDIFEDGVFAFAMAYAGAKSDYVKVRSFEDKLLWKEAPIKNSTRRAQIGVFCGFSAFILILDKNL